jgi:hypothetical protein
MPQNVPITYINGTHYDPSSYEVRIVAPNVGSSQLVGLKILTYDDSLEPGAVTSTYPGKIGRTRGKYAANAGFELYKAFAEDFEAVLARIEANGIYEAPFNIQVTVFEESTNGVRLQPIKDIIKGCRVKKIDGPMPGEGEAASKKYELDVMSIQWNGRKPFRGYRP